MGGLGEVDGEPAGVDEGGAAHAGVGGAGGDGADHSGPLAALRVDGAVAAGGEKPRGEAQPGGQVSHHVDVRPARRGEVAGAVEDDEGGGADVGEADGLAAAQRVRAGQHRRPESISSLFFRRPFSHIFKRETRF